MLKQAQAETEVLKAKALDYEQQLQDTKPSEPGKVLNFAKEKRELEEEHAETLEKMRLDYDQKIIETEKRLLHLMEEEINKVMQESQEELDNLAKLKDKELEVFKESVERRRRRTSQFVSFAEHERLKARLDELTAEVEKENAAIPNEPSKPVAGNGQERQLRQELAEAKVELVKKQSAADKAKIELEKLRHQMQTSKSVTETKMSILKSKVKTLEGQLAKKNPTNDGFSTPTAEPTTPVAGDSGPANRFQRAEPRTVKTTVKGPPRFSTFSTSPYLSKTVKRTEETTTQNAAAAGSPTMRFTASTFKPRISSPVLKQSSPLRKNISMENSPPPKLSGTFKLSPRRLTTAGVDPAKQTENGAEQGTAISKVTGKKVSLFDDDDVEPAAELEEFGEEPKRRGKRKLNTAQIDIYDGEDRDHPDTPGSVFKRAKLAGSPRASGVPETPSRRTKSSIPGTATRVTAKAKKSATAATASTEAKATAKADTENGANAGVPVTPKARPSGVPVPTSRIRRNITPLKDRNRGIRETFKV